MLCSAGVAKAQYIPAWEPDSMRLTIADVEYWHPKNRFKHLEASLTVGTTGIGIDIATPISQYVQIRAGYDYMPRFHRKYRFDVQGDGQAPSKYDDSGNRQETQFSKIANYMYKNYGSDLADYVDLKGKLTMSNFKLLVDVYPFQYDKAWHITAGIYWGPREFARMDNVPEAETTLKIIQQYNEIYRSASDGDEVKSYGLLSIGMGNYSHNFKQGNKECLMNGAYQMEPSDECTVEISGTSNAIKPYIGLGYGGRLLPKRNDWKITGELGVLIWGGTPSQITHDNTNLSKDVKDYPHKITGIIKALKVYPVLSVRIAKTIF